MSEIISKVYYIIFYLNLISIGEKNVWRKIAQSEIIHVTQVLKNKEQITFGGVKTAAKKVK